MFLKTGVVTRNTTVMRSMKVCAVAVSCVAVLVAQNGDWPVYGHDPGDQRFSPLEQINRQNVASLKVAWTYRTGDAYQPKDGRPTAFEATPLYVDGTLYLGTPLGSVIALDPASGKQKWKFTSEVHKDDGFGDFANRGVSTWKPETGGRRIYIATVNAQLFALDAATGAVCKEFGDNGRVDLRENLRIPVRKNGYADYEETSPPAIIGNTIVVGSGIADNGSTDQPSGEVRGFDAATGKLKWTWDPIPQDPHGIGADTWKNGSAAKTGAANAWSIIATDPVRKLVFIPTGSASPDYYGGERLGDNLFANSIVALEAETGKLVWYFQTVHHDLWDYDVACPPLLFDIQRNGETIPALAVGPKDGNLFILNRETGKPIFGVEERPVPKTDVPGETTAPTQPFPILPQPITAQSFPADQAFGVTDEDRKWCRDEISKLRNDGVFTPPSLQGSLMIPGNIGGMAWGGITYDRLHDLLILPENHLAAVVRLVPRDQVEAVRKTEQRRLNGDWEFARQAGTPYAMMRRMLLSPNRVPCTAPPWGTLLAIQASTGKKVWEVPLGRFPGLNGGPAAPPEWGSIALGGPISTAGGLVFTGGTFDPAIYAFDTETGKQLWKGELPTSARSTPMTFLGPDGKQYVIISAGGHGVPGASPLGDYVVAFSL